MLKRSMHKHTLCCWSIWCVVNVSLAGWHEHGLYPYHKQKIQKFNPQDYKLRVQYCHDDATLTEEGIFHSKSNICFANANVHAVYEHGHQDKFKVSVLVGIFENHMIGLYILPH
ncbi:hypothetical protein PR048_013307 [Dryococelus australis]|uniref:Uncharacterized protein n=1 Tax=Dryococelus australis TaxID=614101 RepID=A0ABQ9HS83_9NEOP|nr:hypothetical protein PR048_013307 [Dryococelus australis]